MNQAVEQQQPGASVKADNLEYTPPLCDGSFPGWRFKFATKKGVSAVDVIVYLSTLFPNGVEEVKVSGDRTISVKILGTRGLFMPAGVYQFHIWLVGSPPPTYPA